MDNLGAVHKVRVSLFLANFDPLPCHTLSHTPRPPELRNTSRTPQFFSKPSTKSPDKSPLCKFSLNCSRRFLSGGFCPLSGRFCPGWFLSVPPSVRIRLLQQKVKHRSL